MKHEIQKLLRMLDQAYDKKTWHGPNLRGSLRGVTANQAAWRPSPGRHNIWELAVHAAYWKYAVRRRLRNDKRNSFPATGSNWFSRPVDRSEKAWRADLRLLENQHRTLRDAIRALPPARLLKIQPGTKYTDFDCILGVAYHDVYHAGQIQLLKRLFKSGRPK